MAVSIHFLLYVRSLLHLLAQIREVLVFKHINPLDHLNKNKLKVLNVAHNIIINVNYNKFILEYTVKKKISLRIEHKYKPKNKSIYIV